MFEKSLAVLITDVHQKKNRHMIGEIVEVFWEPSKTKDGIIGLPTVTGDISMNDRGDILELTPDYVFDVRHLEILEFFDDNLAQEELNYKWLMHKFSLLSEYII